MGFTRWFASSRPDMTEGPKQQKVATAPPPFSWKAMTSRSTVIPQAQKVGKTLFETHSTHKVTGRYRALAA
jgi:hypothetical protein